MIPAGGTCLLILVALSALDVLALPTALYLSVAVDTVAMFVWGCVSDRLMGAGLGPA